MVRKKSDEYIHTVTRLGTVSIPIPLRRKYSIGKGTKVRFVDAADGIRLIPLISLKSLFGMDKEKAGSLHVIIREILDER
jgi:bifunctional DNA-binding transcriptional regulator/antitoxin component of YhaV-PrlF toxin-antitoxin module